MLRIWAARLVVAGLLVSLGGCKVAIRVGVEANQRGSGRVLAVVTLDPDAQRYVGTLQLETADLVKAGWKVAGPTKIARGELQVTATKAFATPAQAQRIVRELDQGSGLFRDFRLVQQRSFFKTSSKFRGTVDLSKGLETFSDDELRATLGPSLGATQEEFAQRIGTALADALPMTVGVRLPGEVTANAPQASGGAAAWHPRLGERVELTAAATHWNVRGVALAAVAVVAGALGLLSALRYRRRRRFR